AQSRPPGRSEIARGTLRSRKVAEAVSGDKTISTINKAGPQCAAPRFHRMKTSVPAAARNGRFARFDLDVGLLHRRRRPPVALAGDRHLGRRHGVITRAAALPAKTSTRERPGQRPFTNSAALTYVSFLSLPPITALLVATQIRLRGKEQSATAI